MVRAGWARTVTLGTVALALAMTLGSAVVDASEHWRNSQKACMSAMANPESASEAQLTGCADDFWTDAQLDSLSDDDRGKIERALRHLYQKGSEKSSRIARFALTRLDVKLAPRGSDSGAVNRPKYDPPEAKSADREAAEKLDKEAAAVLKKEKWRDAIALLVKALERDPRNERVLFHLASAEAQLDEKDRKAYITHLQYLSDLGTDAAAELLVKARSDAHFEPVRDDIEFKRLTGYLRALVINTVDDVGVPGVENIMKLFDKLGHRKPDKKEEDKQQPMPTVQFKPHAKAQAGVIAELLNDPQTQLEPITEGKYDLVIRWGTRTENGKPVNLGPETADDAVAKARQKQNRALAQPEAAINKVNRVLDTPGRTISEVGKMKDRVLGVGDKAKGAVDKVKDLEKLGDKTKDAFKIKGL